MGGGFCLFYFKKLLQLCCVTIKLTFVYYCHNNFIFFQMWMSVSPSPVYTMEHVIILREAIPATVLLAGQGTYARQVSFLPYLLYNILSTKIKRGSYTSAHVLLNLLNELGIRDKM